MFKANWTEQMIDHVRLLVAENKSAAQIAIAVNEKFGTGYSRNAIIGIVNRQRLGPLNGRPGNFSQARGKRSP